METDAVLVARSNEVPEAFGAVYERHVDAVYSYIARRSDRMTAEDLLAEVFARAFRNRAGFDTARSNARPWLYGIAANVLREHYRQRARRRDRESASVLVAVPTDGDIESVDDRLVAQVEAQRVRSALAMLPATDREVLTLVAWEQLSYEEIAQAADTPIGTVRSRIHRARAKLAELLRADEQQRGNVSCGGRNRHG